MFIYEQIYKLLDEDFLNDMKENALPAGQTPTQQQLDSEKARIFTHMNKIYGYVLE